MLFPGRNRWLKYTKLAESKTDEIILHEEDNVKVIDDVTGELLASEMGGSSGRTTVKATVKITNQRILHFQNNVPIGIVNYVVKEADFKTGWLYFYRGFFLNINKKDISFGRDNKGNEYLEIVSIRKNGRFFKKNIKRRYFFRNMNPVKEIFA